MTDEEKAEEYLKKNKICNNENWEVGGKYCYTLCKQSYLDGLAEGRKEICLELNKDGTIRPCEVMKENEQLKAQVEKYKTEKNYYDNLCHNKTVECDDLRKGIKQFQSDNDKFIKKIEEIAEENAELKAQVEQLSNDNHVLKTSFITQREQIEKMKNCYNCKHNNEQDAEFCCNCDRPYEGEVIKDKWEMEE